MTIQTFDSAAEVAEEAARLTIEHLHAAITSHGHAAWVLAGGTTPNLTYAIIADGYLDRIDWGKVTCVIGDERIGPLNGPDNNWQVIENVLLQHIPEATCIRPRSDLPAEQAAADYEQRISAIERFDVTWLGVGEDGHTLSLFPTHMDFNPDDTHLVVPVRNSPKPPADRISLTLTALTRSSFIIILATGSAKRSAYKQALQPGSTLPVAQAARTAPSLWLTDIVL